MKKVLFLVMALVFALSACAFANELYNGSWELGNDEGWLRTGGNIVDLNTYYGNCGPASGQEDVFGFADASNWGMNSGTISQDVYCAPDVWNIALTGWLRAKDDSGMPSYVTLELLIDDVLVGEQAVSIAGSAGQWADTGWVHAEIYWTGFIAGKMTAKVSGVAHGAGGWGLFYADGINLEIVPEPASMLALAAGLVGMVIRRRK